MVFPIVSVSVMQPIDESIQKNLANEKQPNFCKRNIISRVAYLGFVPLAFVTTGIDTIIGVTAGIFDVLSNGRQAKIHLLAKNELEASNQLLKLPFMGFLRVINPKIQFIAPDDMEDYRDRLNNVFKKGVVSVEGDGFVSDYVHGYFDTIAAKCTSSNNYLVRHVASRFSYAVRAIVCLVARTADGILAGPAALCASITLGKFSSLNNLAIRTLQAPAIIRDLYTCAFKGMNPWG